MDPDQARCKRKRNQAGFNPALPSAPPAPPCPGWPEYLGQTKQALARGYHVLALQSNSPSGCWSSSNSKPGFVDDRIDVRPPPRAAAAALK